MQDKQKIIFLHIPKTAGSTFNTILARTYSADKRFVVSGGSAVPSNYQYEAASLNFERLDQKIINQVDLISGHMPFRLLNAVREQHFKYITFLRDPIKRVISDYRYVTTTPGNALYFIVRDLPLIEYVSRKDDLQLDNLQTRLITGKMQGEMDESDVEDALINISKYFSFVGFTEHFDISLIYLKKLLKWPEYQKYKVENATKGSSYRATDLDISVIEKHNIFDIKLYNHCLKIFNNKIDEDLDFIKIERRKLKEVLLRAEKSYLQRIFDKLSR